VRSHFRHHRLILADVFRWAIDGFIQTTAQFTFFATIEQTNVTIKQTVKMTQHSDNVLKVVPLEKTLFHKTYTHLRVEL